MPSTDNMCHRAVRRVLLSMPNMRVTVIILQRVAWPFVVVSVRDFLPVILSSIVIHSLVLLEEFGI